jgi:type IX secretion system PorP/SprF family membrane protein
MKKIFTLSVLFIGSFVPSFGQIDPLYAQYLYNPVVINPAYTGMNKYMNLMAGVRKQWAGFDGSPTTINITGHTSLFDNKMGVGLMITEDQIGENKNTIVQASYAYKIDLGGTFVSFGLQAGMVNYRSDNFALNPYDDGDEVFMGKQNTTKPTIGTGIILKSDKMFLGLSVPRLLKAKETFDGVESELYTQHFYAFGSYVFMLTPRLRLKPAVLLKAVNGSPLSADVNVQFLLNEQVSAGVLTRNLNTYGAMVQLKFSQVYKFGYVLEVPTNNSVGFRFTTHEVTLGINLAVLDFHDKFEVSDF